MSKHMPGPLNVVTGSKGPLGQMYDIVWPDGAVKSSGNHKRGQEIRAAELNDMYRKGVESAGGITTVLIAACKLALERIDPSTPKRTKRDAPLEPWAQEACAALREALRLAEGGAS